MSELKECNHCIKHGYHVQLRSNGFTKVWNIYCDKCFKKLDVCFSEKEAKKYKEY